MDLLTILQDRGVEYKKTNNPSRILIRCTSGLHQDNNPSLSYDLDKNVFKCWSCDFRGGGARFLESIGITTRVPVETKQSFKVEKLLQKIHAYTAKEGIRLPSNKTTVDFPFKGISEGVLSDFGAFTTQELGLEDYICIPVYQFGRLRFIEGRLRYADSKKPKYYRRPYGASTAQTLFPIDKIDKTSHVYLVEGLFDMLNMWQHGYRNVLCIFGTQSFGQPKIDLLDQIGVTRVTLLMDGDAAGSRAATSIKKILEVANISTETITLKENTDPGSLSKTELSQIIK
jgi:DNA primase